MSRFALALTTAAAIGFAAPAAAFSVSFTLPNLTYPPVTTPDVSQGCTDLSVGTATCAPVSR